MEVPQEPFGKANVRREGHFGAPPRLTLWYGMGSDGSHQNKSLFRCQKGHSRLSSRQMLKYAFFYPRDLQSCEECRLSFISCACTHE